jgi:hypothetical protein
MGVRNRIMRKPKSTSMPALPMRREGGRKGGREGGGEGEHARYLAAVLKAYSYSQSSPPPPFHPLITDVDIDTAMRAGYT